MDAIFWDYPGGDTFCHRCGGCGTACRLELWDSDAIFVTQNLNVGYIVHQLDLMLTVGKNKVGIPNTCTFCIYYCTW